MINHTELTAGKGRFKVTLFLQETGGHGLCCFLTGGERPHVGGTVLASLSERVNGGGMTCNLWNIPLPGHKDSYLAENWQRLSVWPQISLLPSRQGCMSIMLRRKIFNCW